MDWPSYPPIVGQGIIISTMNQHGFGQMLDGANTLSGTWNTSNRAVYMPVRISEPVLARKLFWFNGATVSGNADCGIYDAAGTKIVSAGSTAQSGTNALQEVDIADTLLDAGLFYMGLALDNTTGTFFRLSVGTAYRAQAMGTVMQATAFPLPAAATFAAYTDTVTAYVCGFSGRVVI